VIYTDTSVIIKLYIREKYSFDASNWFKKNNEAIPLTSIHDLEFQNAINLKQFRSEIAQNEADFILSKFNSHESKGVFYRPRLNWSDVFKQAVILSRKHTVKTGSRSLDILHVASAISIKADKFLTFDERQAKLASLAGLTIEKILK